MYPTKSRTVEGKHTPRFIVQFKLDYETHRSNNFGLSHYFLTRAAANAAVEQWGSAGITYTVRQK